MIHSFIICYEINVSLYLIIVKLTVLQVGRGGDGAHTCVGVVVRVLAHTVWETILEKGQKEDVSLLLLFFVIFPLYMKYENTKVYESFPLYRHSRSQQGACRVGHVASFSFVLHQEVCPPAAAVHLPLLVTHNAQNLIYLR